MRSPSDVALEIELNGYAIIENAVDDLTASVLIADILEAAVGLSGRGIRRRTQVYAIRNLLDVVPATASLARSAEIRSFVDAVLGRAAIPVRGILFDKTQDANWTVPWHQDVAIAVAERVDVEGFTGWSVKAGVPHVHPPAWIMELMLSVRLHLDDCGPDNGPLEVIPGSHRFGKLDDTAVDRTVPENAGITCGVRAGGIILMRPLLLHRSLSAVTPAHRRVIHIEYAAAYLPGGLRWFVDY